MQSPVSKFSVPFSKVSCDWPSTKFPNLVLFLTAGVKFLVLKSSQVKSNFLKFTGEFSCFLEDKFVLAAFVVNFLDLSLFKVGEHGVFWAAVCLLELDTVLTSTCGNVFFIISSLSVPSKGFLLPGVAVDVAAPCLLCGLFCFLSSSCVFLLESRLSSSSFSCFIALLAVAVGHVVCFTLVLLNLVLVATPNSLTFIMTSSPCSFLAISRHVALFLLFVLVLQLLVVLWCLFIVWQTVVVIGLLVWGLTWWFMELLLAGVAKVVFFSGIHFHGGDGGIWGLFPSWQTMLVIELLVLGLTGGFVELLLTEVVFF